MPATVTLTGTAGPGLTVAATVFANITSFNIDTVTNMITMIQLGGVVIPPISINAATVVTATKTGTVWTLVIS